MRHSAIALEPQTVSICIPGVPIGKGRPRFTTQGGFARSFTPAKTRGYEDMIRCEAANAMGGRAPFDAACTVSMTAYVPIPKAFSKRRRELALAGILKPTTRPDLDNYAKLLDGCNAIIFSDDSLITDLFVQKRYSERPRLVITIETEAEYG